MKEGVIQVCEEVKTAKSVCDEDVSELLCCCNDCRTAFQMMYLNYTRQSIVHCVQCGKTKVRVISVNNAVINQQRN